MDGIEAARRMRCLSGGDAARLIALSGWGQDIDRKRTQAADFDDYLTKPVNVALLRDMLRQIV